MKSIITLALIAIATTASADYTIIPETGDYTIAKDSVVLHGDVAPVKVVPVVVEPVTPPVTPPVVVPDTPPVTDTPHVTPPTLTGKLIPGGTKTAPIVISASGTYTVQDDMVCDATCIDIKASGVVLDLNGKTLTYNQTAPGEGVKVSAYNRNNVTIKNGRIKQGVANSEGDVYGKGNNPILATLGVYKLTVQNINAEWSGRDVGGIQAVGDDMLIEGNTLNDLWSVGTLKNRGQGVSAISTMQGGKSKRAIVRNNAIIRARHQGIKAYQDAQVYGNTINIDSMATNSMGINVGPGSKVWGNKVVGRGEHPIGIFYSEASILGAEFWNNEFDLQVTALGEEYGGDAKCFNPATPCGNYANGFRSSWNGNNINFHDNTIKIRVNARYTGRYNPTGEQVVVDGKGRGIMVGMDYPNQHALFENNVVEVIDETPGLGTAIGLACSANVAGNIVFKGGRVATNGTNVAFGDYYGKCLNYPIVTDVELVRVGDNPKYLTFEAAWEGYSDGTGRVLQNTYTNGASPDKINLWPAKRGAKSIYFGREVPGAAGQEGLPFDGAGAVYDYELHNRNATTTQKRIIP